MARTKIFFGTGNAKKLKEINEILGDRYEIISFRDLPEKIEVIEDRPTLEGNAIKKAREFHAATGLPCFSDDTGLEVEALDGRPGVYSARYAGEDGNAERNMAKLLEELQGQQNRAARFRTVIAYVNGEELQTFDGVLNGQIGHEKRGDQGFGYDPLFIPEGDHRTLAEHSADEKNAISHRGRAVRKFANFLK